MESEDDEVINAVISDAVEEQEARLAEQDSHLPWEPTVSPSVAVAPPKSGDGFRESETRVATGPAPLNFNHQYRRLEGYKRKRKLESMSEGARKRSWRGKKAMERTVALPVDVTDLRTSYKTSFEPKAYAHEELKSLGIKTIEWDGRRVFL